MQFRQRTRTANFVKEQEQPIWPVIKDSTVSLDHLQINNCSSNKEYENELFEEFNQIDTLLQKKPI